MDAFVQFVLSFLVPFMMNCKDGARNFTALVYSILLNTGKSVLKMMETVQK
jgi:hypothetical protein